MASLVQFLVAGVRGAESGSATFLLRGTASSAAAVLYNDFEETAQPGTNVISLDANGTAEVYCDAYVDVVIRNSAGTTLRTVTMGHSAPVVEVESTSFTGTDYDGSPANTIGEPITLKALLDKWITSAGSPDWQVLIGGSATNLTAAFAGTSGLVINVKDPAFGALGDGVTDDTTAITAANAAAAGRPVYFPPGTYKITTLSLSDVNLNWLGAGPGASVISGTTSTNLIALTNNTNTGWKNFSNLSFGSSGAYNRLFNLEESQNVTFNRCTFDASLCSSDAIERGSASGLSKYLFSDCDFVLGATTLIGIFISAPTASSHIAIEGCHFRVPSGFTGDILFGPGFNVANSRFDASAVTSGTYHHIVARDVNVAGKYVGVFNGNTFLDGGSTGFVFQLTSLGSACDFSEDGNTFIGFTAPSASAEKGRTYEITDAESGVPGDIWLGSRQGRTVHITNTAATFTASACLEAEHVVIDHGTTGGLTITIPALIPGLSGNVVVYRNVGTGDVSFRGNDIGDGSVSASIISCTDVTNGLLFASIADEFAGSCDYITTTRASGVYRSLIRGVFEHNTV